MGERLGEVLPGVSRGVVRDERTAPGAVVDRLVVRVKGFGVVKAFIAEHRTEIVEPFLTEQAVVRVDQRLPIPVPEFVANMAGRRAILLAESRANLCEPHRIALCDVERDHAIGMAGGDGIVWRAFEQLESQLRLEPCRIEPQREQLTKCSPTSRLERFDERALIWDQIETAIGTVITTERSTRPRIVGGSSVRRCTVCGDPIAGARPKSRGTGRHLERVHERVVYGIICDLGSAGAAAMVVEEERARAARTGESTHQSILETSTETSSRVVRLSE